MRHVRFKNIWSRKGNWDWDSVTYKITMVSRVISIAILLTRLLYNFIFSFAMFFYIIFLFTRKFSNVHDLFRILIFLIKILFLCSNREGEKDSIAAFYALGRIFKNKKTRCNRHES